MATQTYNQIASLTLSADTSNVTFFNIPQTYTDLVLITTGRIVTTPYNPDLRLNSDSGTNYSFTELGGSGAVAASSRDSNRNYLRIGSYGYFDTSNSYMGISHFINYSNTTTFKTVLSRSSNINNGTSFVAATWRSTAAINTIALFGGTYSSGLTFNLYGIKAA